MADEDGGLELNIFSAPAAPQPTRKKKRGSGKAWDKKKQKRQDTLAAAADEASTTALTSKQLVHAPPAGADRATARGHDEAPLSSRNGSPDSHEMATVAGSKSSPDRNTATMAGRVHSSHSPSSAAEVGAVAIAALGPTAKLLHPETSNSSSSKKTAGSKKNTANNNTKEPSHERRRVLEMAGRVVPSPSNNSNATAKTTSTTANNNAKHPDNKTMAAAVGSKRGDKTPAKASPSSSSSSARPAKRKRSSEPVLANGVIDFTAGNADHDKPRSDKHIRRAAATAAAVAKATDKMDKAGGDKWWDDDDDDHVPAIVASKTQPAPYTRGGKFDWNYGNGAGACEGEEEDKDGGLPSEIRPNSVRTKAVDMDAEASNAMGILASLLGSAGGGAGAGARAEPRRLKNGGKSKKRAREEMPTPRAASESGTGAASTARDGGDDSGPGVVTPVPLAKGEEETEGNVNDAKGSTTATAVSLLGKKESNPDPEPANTAAAGNGDDRDTTPPTHKPGDDELGAAAADDNSESAETGLITRKTRGKHEREVAQNSSHNSVPLPEHHARPRELSRRAAPAPLPSARSAHVMAAGPGATFAALGMPAKMVAHLVEPRGENGGGGMGLVGPTVCQLAAVSVLAAGHNTVVKSETGSGKTLAYLLPLLCDLAAMEPRVEREHGTLAVVLAPTRELCAQILEVGY